MASASQSSLRVLKFGGTSVGSLEAIRATARIVSDSSRDGPRVVIVSAMSGVTNTLVEATRVAASGGPGWAELVDGILRRHREVAEALGPSADPGGDWARALAQRERDLRDLLHGVSLVREASPRSIDAILAHGELLSIHSTAGALRVLGAPAEAVDARAFVRSTGPFGNARVVREETDPAARRVLVDEILRDGRIPVVTGFIASGPKGETTTLGRGGSDYTAAALGAALGAEAIEIWTDVDGVMTADPRLVPSAFSLPALSYSELMELAHFGAKVVYPPTVRPAAEAGIPLLIRNTFRPEFPGTRVEAAAPPLGDVPIRGVASMREIALVRLEGDGIVGVPGIAGRFFGALAARGINIILISQASSERSICLAIEPGSLEDAQAAIRTEFELECRLGILEDLVIEDDASIIAVVGEAMRATPGIAGKVFSILGDHGINIRAIAQGSSELNLSAVVSRNEAGAAIRAVHDAFFDRRTPPVRVFLAGAGRVGKEFLSLLVEPGSPPVGGAVRRPLLLAGVVRKSGGVVDLEKGIDPTQAIEQAGRGTGTLAEMVDAAVRAAPEGAVFVDLTADPAPPRAYPRLLAAGVPVVTANKRGPAAPAMEWEALRRSEGPARFYGETTVGAALPVLGPLADLVAAGDRVRRIEGVLSGTLSYLFGRAREGTPFSALVREAHSIGFTEPDPRDDLGGADVSRKLVILGRQGGLPVDPADVRVDPILPGAGWDDLDLDGFWRRLEEVDPELEARIVEASARGHRLVHLASIDPQGARIRLQEVGPEHPAWGLRPGDNLVSVHSTLYDSHPLVIQGPGAGTRLTAAGVLADLLRAVAILPLPSGASHGSRGSAENHA